MASPNSRWERYEKYFYLFFKVIFYLSVGLAVLWLLRQISTVTTPILLALFLAYLTSPLVDLLEKRRIPRLLTAIAMVVLVMVGLFVFLVFLIPRLIEQGIAFAERLPYYVSDALLVLRPGVERNLDLRVPIDPMQIQGELRDYIQSMIGDWGNLIETMLTSAFAIALALANLLLIPLFMVYLLKDFPAIREASIEVVPPRHRARVSDIIQKVNAVMSSFVRGTVIVVSILAVLYSVVMSILGIPFAILIGIAAAVLNVIPYLGPIMGLVLTLLMVFLEGMGVGTTLGVLVLFAVVPILDAAVISPHIVGDKVGLPPIGVIIAILSFGQLFGLVGILVAVPVTAVLKILVLEAVHHYRESEFFRGT